MSFFHKRTLGGRRHLVRTSLAKFELSTVTSGNGAERRVRVEKNDTPATFVMLCFFLSLKFLRDLGNLGVGKDILLVEYEECNEEARDGNESHGHSETEFRT